MPRLGRLSSCHASPCRPRRLLAIYGIAMVIGFVASGLLGFQLDPHNGSQLSEPAAAAALTFAFQRDLGLSPKWHHAEGTSTHGWLTRWAHVLGAADGTRYSEQVLKVGWPFTMVRGFVRTMGEDERHEGVLVVRGDPSAGPVRLLPIQPVWPGMILNSLWLTAALLALAKLGGDWPGRNGTQPRGIASGR